MYSTIMHTYSFIALCENIRLALTDHDSIVTESIKGVEGLERIEMSDVLVQRWVKNHIASSKI